MANYGFTFLVLITNHNTLVYMYAIIGIIYVFFIFKIFFSTTLKLFTERVKKEFERLALRGKSGHILSLLISGQI